MGFGWSYWEEVTLRANEMGGIVERGRPNNDMMGEPMKE